MTHTVYMDHNATSPTRKEAREAAMRAMEVGGNPSSVHAAGRAARRIVEDAREHVRGAVGASSSAQIIFTSCGTEANTLALRGCGRDKAFVGATEHASVMLAHDHVERIVVNGQGLIDPFQLEEMFAGGGDDVIVSVMLANNETGVLQQIEGIVNIAKRYHALVHCDAIQALGKVDVNFESLGVDMMSISAHKIAGPLGVGALVAHKDMKLIPSNRGGGQEHGLRGGTENLPGIAGFGVAAELATAELRNRDKIRALRDQLEVRIQEIAPNAKILAQTTERLPNTSCIVMPGVSGETQVMAFDLAGVCVSAGSACASGKSKASTVLTAMGFDHDTASSTVRVSLSGANTEDDIQHFISAWADLYQRKGADRPAA